VPAIADHSEQTDAMKSTAAFLSDPPTGPSVTAAYEADLAVDGYVNNLTRVWYWRPDVLSGFHNLRTELAAVIAAGLTAVVEIA
jgi:hypothetical protein